MQTRDKVIIGAQRQLLELQGRRDLQSRKVIDMIKRFRTRLKRAMEESR